MPWIDHELCTGCGICVDDCVVGAIYMDGNFALINERECIRCGICHDACPNGAVRHDSEQIPQEVEANLSWVRALLGHAYYANDREKQRAFIDRMKRHHMKNKRVAEKTIEGLQALANEFSAEATE
jgi:ferredoxin